MGHQPGNKNQRRSIIRRRYIINGKKMVLMKYQSISVALRVNLQFLCESLANTVYNGLVRVNSGNF